MPPRPARPRAHLRRAPAGVLWAAVALLLALAWAHAQAPLARAAEPTASGGWSLPGIDDVPEPRPELTAALHAAADAARSAHGLPGTTWDEGLARAARQHAAELALLGVLTHTSPTPGRHTLADRLARAGSPYASHGENLAFLPSGFDVTRAAIDGWLASPGHRANLLEPGFDRVGFGTALHPDGVFVVQVLAGAPWAPASWSAELAQATSYRVTLGLRADRARTALVEIAGRTERVELSAGRQRWTTVLEGSGPWPLRVGVLTRPPAGFTLDDAGAVASSGRWRPGDAPRTWVRVTGAEVEPVRSTVVRMRLAVPAGPAGLALLLDGTHRPEATRTAGVELELELADGQQARLALAEPDGAGRLLVRHGFVVRRDGDQLIWGARP